jgi:hypothetical protein
VVGIAASEHLAIAIFNAVWNHGKTLNSEYVLFCIICNRPK